MPTRSATNTPNPRHKEKTYKRPNPSLRGSTRDGQDITWPIHCAGFRSTFPTNCTRRRARRSRDSRTQKDLCCKWTRADRPVFEKDGTRRRCVAFVSALELIYEGCGVANRALYLQG